VTSTLTLPDGQQVHLGERTQGGSKNNTRYGTLGNGRPVVVKIQATHGHLRSEEAALTFAAGQGLPTPTVVGSGVADDGGYFLVLTEEIGSRTNQPDGWQRMGQDYARLAGATIIDCPLPTVRPDRFAADHRERLDAIKAFLTGPAEDEIRRAIRHLANTGRLVLTHGDPGSGNYLDSPAGGTILDWETASVAPFGIDAGRAGFIALLDLGRTGIPDQLHAAFIRGYRAGLPAGQSLTDQTLRAGVLIAALQFIHGRHTQPLRPDRTPQLAVDALTGYLGVG